MFSRISKNMKVSLIITICLMQLSFYSLISVAQVVWKSDGTVIDADGNIKKESYGVRFQNQLSNPSKDWPKASGRGQSPKNYFGNELFIPGTPLLRMSGIDLRSNYIEKIAKLNHFSNVNDLQKFIIGSANHSFLDQLNLSEENAIIFISSSINTDKINLDENEVVALMRKKKKEKLSLQVLKNINEKVSDTVDKKVEKQVEKQVQEQVEKQVQEQIEKQVQEQVYESLSDFFDRLEADYIAKGWTICSRTENGEEGELVASSSSDGCR